MEQSDQLQVLIVDDEAPARQNLTRLVRAIGGATVVGEATDGRTAVQMILAGGIDLVLLDIQMPELDGLSVVRTVGVTLMPSVVFVTAYDQYAIAAFDLHATGYLLKPVSRAKLAEQLARVRSQRAVPRETNERLLRLLEALEPARVTRLAVRRDGCTTFVRTIDIDWIEAANVSARIHAGGRVYEIRETLTELERTLPANEFVRVHRSAIVRLESIREIQPWFRGTHVLILADGSRVTTGRTYRHVTQRLLGHH
jgi:two-component system LytT family response regulator